MKVRHGVLISIGIVTVALGITVYLLNILNPISNARMLVTSILVFLCFILASGYFNSLFDRRTK